ncbi:putative H(+)-transporting two-sector ATPase [Helianthus anomalus]
MCLVRGERGGMKGITLSLENENVRIVVFSSDNTIKEGDFVKRTGSVMDVPAGKAMLGVTSAKHLTRPLPPPTHTPPDHHHLTPPPSS